MKIYHLKTCDACRKAIRALEGRAPEIHEIRESPVPREVLAGWLERAGAETLLNRRSTTWRGLSEAERAGDPLSLLLAHPTLMRRPVIEDAGALHVGWGPEVRSALGLD